jgi:hypothetical protein
MRDFNLIVDDTSSCVLGHTAHGDTTITTDIKR